MEPRYNIVGRMNDTHYVLCCEGDAPKMLQVGTSTPIVFSRNEALLAILCVKATSKLADIRMVEV